MFPSKTYWLATALVLLVAAPVAAQETTSPRVSESPADDRDQTDEGEGSSSDQTPATEPSADELTAEAEQRFADGQYDEAIALLKRAYDQEANPNTIYNIARVFEAKGDLRDALTYYHQFVVAPGVELEHRDEALERAKTIREIIAATDEDSGGSKAPPVERSPSTSDQMTASYDAPARWRTVGIGLTIAGGATLAAGGVTGVLALRSEDEFRRATQLDAARDAATRTRTLATATDVLFISGGVVALTGLVIALAQPRSETVVARSRGRLDVIAGSGGAAAMWTIEF